MKKVLFLCVVVVFLGLCYAQDAEQDPAKGKCPKDLSMLEFIRPRYCHKEKPYCPRGLICCPCPKTGKKYCIRLRTDDGESVDTREDETLWQAMKEEFTQNHKEHYDCDDDDDDDDHKEKKDGDMVFELDRTSDLEEGHGHKKHHTKCHRHKNMHKVVKIVVPIVGLLIIVSIVVTVFCCIRCRRMRRAEMTKNSPYTPGNIAPVPEKEKGSMKGFLGLDFSPEVFVSSQSSYKKLEEEKERI
ncbi:uncharacterized protein LOC125671570 isoform X2 [Ostrea edulis]|uniref:uncharacterized protein LOC125671570 isoform X2 n=1 Tax=Ostrea edulis TaxID=37623 RepID=UPI0024AEBF6C|nr:uncharacterized protein LOC125671570 isoform X2 [Ostrea edulis]